MLSFLNFKVINLTEKDHGGFLKIKNKKKPLPTAVNAMSSLWSANWKKKALNPKLYPVSNVIIHRPKKKCETAPSIKEKAFANQ